MARFYVALKPAVCFGRIMNDDGIMCNAAIYDSQQPDPFDKDKPKTLELHTYEESAERRCAELNKLWEQVQARKAAKDA